MIFYGSKTIPVGQKVLNGIQCNKCDKDTVVLTNLYTSGHIFWIPFLWVFKNTIGICTGCKKRMSLTKLNKKYNLGMTKDQMKDIQAELDAQIKPEDSKVIKRRNVIGIITFSLLILFFILALSF